MTSKRRDAAFLRRRALQFQRYQGLVQLLQSDYDAYVATASFLSPSRIARNELPNVQDVPYDKNYGTRRDIVEDDGIPLVADCELEDMRYQENILDKVLLAIFRRLVTKHTGGITSEKKSIQGLLEQGRSFMLQEGQTPEAQHKWSLTR